MIGGRKKGQVNSVMFVNQQKSLQGQKPQSLHGQVADREAACTSLSCVPGLTSKPMLLAWVMVHPRTS